MAQGRGCIVVISSSRQLPPSPRGAPWRPTAFPMAISLTFAAYRKGQKIGTHAMAFQDDAGRLVVATSIDFTVHALGLVAYRYRHRAREVWSNGRFMAIATQTDDDGAAYALEARHEGGSLIVRRREPQQSVKTSAGDAALQQPAWIRGRRGQHPADDPLEHRTGPPIGLAEHANRQGRAHGCDRGGPRNHRHRSQFASRDALFLCRRPQDGAVVRRSAPLGESEFPGSRRIDDRVHSAGDESLPIASAACPRCFPPTPTWSVAANGSPSNAGSISAASPSSSRFATARWRASSAGRR